MTITSSFAKRVIYIVFLSLFLFAPLVASVKERSFFLISVDGERMALADFESWNLQLFKEGSVPISDCSKSPFEFCLQSDVFLFSIPKKRIEEKKEWNNGVGKFRVERYLRKDKKMVGMLLHGESINSRFESFVFYSCSGGVRFIRSTFDSKLIFEVLETEKIGIGKGINTACNP